MGRRENELLAQGDACSWRTQESNIRVACFFFSSRRRHTRFDCDWSSDVCSSDLFSRLDAQNACSHQESRFRPLSGIRIARDRKSTRLNSSHSQISYAVFCLKKKNNRVIPMRIPELDCVIPCQATRTVDQSDCRKS